MAVEIVFQFQEVQYSDAVDLIDAGHPHASRMGRLAKLVALRSLRSLQCKRHRAQDLFVVIDVVRTGGNAAVDLHVRGCCAPMTALADKALKEAAVSEEVRKLQRGTT